MDVALPYWNDENKKVEMRYWNSNFLGHAAHRDLLSHFLNSIKDIDKSNIIQVSMDGPSVNMKFYTNLVETQEETQLPDLIDIGTCSLHVIHGALKIGIESTNLEMKKKIKRKLSIAP